MPPDTKKLSNSVLLDYARLCEMADGQPAGVRELSDMYADSMNANLTKLRNALSGEDATTLEHIAHSAVGASSLIGMKVMVPLLREIEHLAEERQLDKIPDALTRLETAYRSLLELLGSENLLTPRAEP